MNGERTKHRPLPRWFTDPIRPLSPTTPLPAELADLLREPAEDDETAWPTEWAARPR